MFKLFPLIGIFLSLSPLSLWREHDATVPVTNSLTTEETTGRPTAVLFVGDIMLGRGVEMRMEKWGDNHSFEKIAPLLETADMVFGNLEGPIVPESTHVRTPDGDYQFSFLPKVAELLHKYNVGFVSLANNHTLNQGAVGYTTTKKILSDTHILFAGHPTLTNDIDSTQTIHVNREPLTIIALNSTFPSVWNPEQALTVVHNHTEDPFVIVFMHWGNEYALSSSREQREFAHALIDNGADLVIGAHPHVVEEIEEYKGKKIFYSLGNFIFDQDFSTDVRNELAVLLEKNGANMQFELFPIKSTKSVPVLMEEPERTQFLESLADRSSPELKQGVLAGNL